jgi:DNA-directed RNA polymerase specialized sigma24 family protein
MTRKKYDFPTTPKPEPKPLFSKDEQRCLARLVAKFGRETVADAAMKVPLPERRGRPSTQKRWLLRVFEDMHLAQSVDEWAEENRRAGTSSQPVRDAIREISDLLGRSPRTIRNRLRRGRRELRTLNQRMKMSPD